jgi:hypothetical protein
MMCLWAKNMKKNFFASLKLMKKGVGSGFRSISQRYGSGDRDPDPHQNVMDPQHWKKVKVSIKFLMENLGWEMRILIRFLYIFSKKYLIKNRLPHERVIYSLSVFSL